jgi:hypothetical protein
MTKTPKPWHPNIVDIASHLKFEASEPRNTDISIDFHD